VSSQTLTNLHVIDQVTQKLVMRPLICSDKSDIIDCARAIGTEDFAKSMPEYCGVISLKPNVKVPLEAIVEEELKCDLDLVSKAVNAANVEDIKKLAEQTEQQLEPVGSTSELPNDAIVIDVRSPAESEHNPLSVEKHEFLHIPFYNLSKEFPELDQQQRYYLYCDRGVMSKMQALLLQEKGFDNAFVFRP